MVMIYIDEDDRSWLILMMMVMMMDLKDDADRCYLIMMIDSSYCRFILMMMIDRF